MLSKSGDAHVARIGEIFGNENFQCYWGLGVQGQGDELGHLFSKEIYRKIFHNMLSENSMQLFSNREK